MTGTTVDLYGTLTATQRALMTQVSRRMIGLEKGEPTPNLSNRKPYRDARLKAQARQEAKKKDGRYVAPTDCLYHPPVKG